MRSQKDTRTFSTIVNGLQANIELENRNIIEASKVKKRYLILFNGRSGSSWLASVLSGRIGFPEEFINPDFLRSVCEATGANTPHRFLFALQGHRHHNGIFGIEATGEHIQIFGEDEFFDAMGDMTVFHLWRENLVAQAVSLYRAVSTGYFHSIDGRNPEDPPYSGTKIMQWMKYLAVVERLNRQIIKRRKINVIPLTYEKITRSREGTFLQFCEALGLNGTVSGMNEGIELKKVTGGWGRDVEMRLRAEFAAEIAELEMYRLI